MIVRRKEIEVEICLAVVYSAVEDERGKRRYDGGREASHLFARTSNNSKRSHSLIYTELEEDQL